MPRSTLVRSTSLSLLLALAGCVGEGKPAVAGGDGAGDGGSPDTAAVDCAAAPLDCDGEDNDCDGVIDEGREHEARQLWGVDADADGYPAATPRLACAGADGESAIALLEAAVDCNDDRFAINPAAVESCLGIGDEDCSGLEGCADPACAGRACAEVCDDGVDNDEDGRTDCRDSLCWGAGCAEDCASAGDEDDNGAANCQDTVCWGPACAELCDQRGDEDGDGLDNCDDPDCFDACPENCREAGDEDRDGLADCEDPDCYVAAVEDCRYMGDEDCDGLADCEDVDCVEACVEDCEDGRDNDMDGAEDCADLDCVAVLRCWTKLELHTPSPVRLQRHRQWHQLFGTESSTLRFDLEVPTLSIAGRLRTDGGGSTACTLRAHEVNVGWLRDTRDGPTSSSWTWVGSWAYARTVDAPEGGCPAVDLDALITDQLRMDGYAGQWFRTVVLLDLGREWALDDLNIGPAVRANGAYPYIWTSHAGSVVTTLWLGAWERSTTTATAVGFAPLP